MNIVSVRPATPPAPHLAAARQDKPATRPAPQPAAASVSRRDAPKGRLTSTHVNVWFNSPDKVQMYYEDAKYGNVWKAFGQWGSTWPGINERDLNPSETSPNGGTRFMVENKTTGQTFIVDKSNATFTALPDGRTRIAIEDRPGSKTPGSDIVLLLEPKFEPLSQKGRALLQDDADVICWGVANANLLTTALTRLGQTLNVNIAAIADPARRAEVQRSANHWFHALHHIARNQATSQWLVGHAAVIRRVVANPETQLARMAVFNAPAQTNNFFTQLYRTQAPGIGVNEPVFGQLPNLGQQGNDDRVRYFMRAALLRSLTDESRWASNVANRAREGATAVELHRLRDPEMVSRALRQMAELAVANEASPRPVRLDGLPAGPRQALADVARLLPGQMQTLQAHPVVVNLATGRSLSQILESLRTLSPVQLRAVMNLTAGHNANGRPVSFWNVLRLLGVSMSTGTHEFKPYFGPKPGDDPGPSRKRPNAQLASGGDSVDVSYTPPGKQTRTTVRVNPGEGPNASHQMNPWRAVAALPVAMRKPLLPDISSGAIADRAIEMVRRLKGGARIQALLSQDKATKDAAHGAMSLLGISNTQISRYAQLALSEGLGTRKLTAAGRSAHSALVRALRWRDVIDDRGANPNLARGGLDFAAALAHAKVGAFGNDALGRTGKLMDATLRGQAYRGAESVYGKSEKSNRRWAQTALLALTITIIALKG
jgi:hypothetical protein